MSQVSLLADCRGMTKGSQGRFIPLETLPFSQSSLQADSSPFVFVYWNSTAKLRPVHWYVPGSIYVLHHMFSLLDPLLLFRIGMKFS
jgi:hypothetical protein